MATEYLTIPKADLQQKLLVLSPADFNLAVVSENATDYFCACAALSGIHAKVEAWLANPSGGNFDGSGEVAPATQFPNDHTQNAFDGMTLAEITTRMNQIVTPV